MDFSALKNTKQLKRGFRIDKNTSEYTRVFSNNVKIHYGSLTYIGTIVTWHIFHLLFQVSFGLFINPLSILSHWGVGTLKLVET